MFKSIWSQVKNTLGWGSAPDQRLALSQTNRWVRLLKALRVEPRALIPALTRELGRGLNDSERRIRPAAEAAFFDALLLGRKTQALDLLCDKLEPESARERVQSKVPSLREWARGALSGALSYAENPEGIEWARARGLLETTTLRSGLMAEAIEMGSSKWALRELQDVGRDRLSAAEAATFMEGFASRKAAGTSRGLDADGLDALAASFGGWGELAEACAGLGPDQIMDFARLLLDALEEEELVEAKIMQEAKAHASKRSRELMALALAAQAAASDRPKALRALVLALIDKGGASVSIDFARVRVGGFEVSLGRGPATLHEIASISGAEGSKKALALINPNLGIIGRGRWVELAGRVQSARPRGSGMGAEPSASTQAWRSAARQWRRALLGDIKMSDMSRFTESQALRVLARGVDLCAPTKVSQGGLGEKVKSKSTVESSGSTTKPL